MNSIAKRLLVISFFASVLNAPAYATSILGDQFTLDLDCASCSDLVPSMHTAELPLAGFSVLARDERQYVIRQGDLYLQWVDMDTFVFLIDAVSSIDTDIVVSLAGLDFSDMGAMHNIVGVSVNQQLTDCPGEFSNCPDVVGPTTSFTDNSLSIAYSPGTALAADGPVWAFDVVTRAAGTAPPVTSVPEPGMLGLFCIGLLALRVGRGRNLVRS